MGHPSPMGVGCHVVLLSLNELCSVLIVRGPEPSGALTACPASAPCCHPAGALEPGVKAMVIFLAVPCG